MSLFGTRDKSGSEGAQPGSSGPRGASGAGAGPAGAKLGVRAHGQGAGTGLAGGEMANIGKSVSIKGDLKGDEDLLIEGNVQGKIELANSQLTVGANGNVSAEVQAKSVVVVGRLTGNVGATERVEIQGSGILEGDVRAPRLVIEEGGVLNGAVEMGAKKADAPSLTRPAAAGGERSGAA